MRGLVDELDRLHSPDAALSPSPAPADLGALPEWRLQDLYEGMDSPRFAADLERAEREAKLFAEVYRGKLARIAPTGRMRARRWPSRSRPTSCCRI